MSAACRDLATKTASAGMAHGAAVREAGFPGLSDQQRIDAAQTRLGALKDRYANAGCPKEHLRKVTRNAAYGNSNDEGIPTPEPPPDIPSGN